MECRETYYGKEHCFHTIGYSTGVSPDPRVHGREQLKCCWCGEYKEVDHGNHVKERLAYKI
jgi:hypothetical protein